MNKEEKCYLCGQELPERVYRLTLLNRAICSFCERRLINTSALDFSYDFYKEKIKKLWVS